MEEKVRQKMTMQKEQMLEEMEVGVAELYTSLQSFESIGVIPIELYEGWILMEKHSSNSEPLFNRLMRNKFSMNMIQDGLKVIDGLGIFCYHCNSEVSASQFESHAGYGFCRKPYSNIYTSNGVSTDLCNYCHEFGDLLCCDRCPGAFHQGESLEVLMVY